MSGYGYGGYGIGLRRLLIFLLVIATIRLRRSWLRLLRIIRRMKSIGSPVGQTRFSIYSRSGTPPDASISLCENL